MIKAPPACTKCWTPLSADFLNIEEYRACPNCAAMVRVEVFPAYFREAAKGSAGEALLADTEASCFYHPQKRAAVVCSECGRFLCSLCDLELEGRHYCASCLETAKEKNKIASLQNKRQLYDTTALTLAIVGIIPWIGFVTAPAALYLAIKHFNTPSSIVRKHPKMRYVAAIVIASLLILGWIVMLGFLFTR
jgi:hypothetical protein